MLICASCFCALVLIGCGGGGGGSNLPSPINVSPVNGGSTGSGAGAGSAAGGGSASAGAGSTAAATSDQTHVLTADYLGSCCGSNSISWSQAAPYLSWAEVSAGDATAVSQAGIKTMDYIDPTRQAATDQLYTSDEATFAHDCSSNRITFPYNSVTFSLMNPGSSDLEADLTKWAAGQETDGHIDAFFFDDTDNLYSVPTMPCNATQSSWDSANSSLISSFHYPVIYNGYAGNSDSEGLISNPNVVGAMAEECYGRDTQPTSPYTTGSLWVTDENLELAAAAAGKQYYCYNNGGYDGSSNVALRQYIYASFLLSYSASSSVLWETFSTASKLHVFPETQLVPTSPRVAAPTSVNALQTSTGAYVREYAACYLKGTNVGPCAAVVNSDPSSAHALPALSMTYGHTLALSGYGVLDGGSASVGGAAPPSSVPPESGFVAFK